MGEVIRFPFEERVRAVRRERLKNGALRDLEGLVSHAANGNKVANPTLDNAYANAKAYGATDAEIIALVAKYPGAEKNFYNPEEERSKKASEMGNPSGRGFKGSAYEETRSLDIAEVAKLVRKDIKAAIKAGELPKGLKTSVRIERFAGGCGLDITVKSLPASFALMNPDRVEFEMHHPHAYTDLPRWTGEGTALVRKLERIMNAYNRDNSDTMTDYFDVKFYGFVRIDGKVETAARTTLMAALA